MKVSDVCSVTLFFWGVCIVSVITAQDRLVSSGNTRQRSVEALYGTWYGAPWYYALTTTKWPSVIAGMLASTRLSSLFIKPFIKKHTIASEEFEHAVSAYTTFNEFFTRTLKKEARPFCPDVHTVISPADGSVLVLEHIGTGTTFPIKGVTFNLERFLNDQVLVDYFIGGTMIVVRLSPWDYHRMHFPLGGTPALPRVIHGVYESVNPFVYTCGIQPLEVNERHIVLLQSKVAGAIALVPVGALFVGAITHTYQPDVFHAKADELGYFSFGGSTVVILFKAGAVRLAPALVESSAQGIETPIKMGMTLGWAC